jgi:predicted dehydrogenase
MGPVANVAAMWQLGARHKIESEDVVSSVLCYQSGATGVIQASTAMWPGYSERMQLHGTKGSAIITGDRLTAWDVLDDAVANKIDPAPVQATAESGSSDPMNISVLTFERQFLDFAEAIKTGREPLSSGEDGFRALQIVLAVYDSCRNNRFVSIQ